MGNFAKIIAGVVVDVQCSEDVDLLNRIIPGDWIQTSRNTRGGVHLMGGTPLRKNYAGIGYTYDLDRDAFIPPKPDFPSWVLNNETCLWEAPIPCPNDDGSYAWNEDTLSWDLATPLE